MAGRKCAICREYTDYKLLDADGVCQKPGCQAQIRQISKWAKEASKLILNGQPMLKKGFHV